MKNNKDVDSLSHTTWRCQYHVVFAPKYRRMVIYGQIKKDIGQILRKLCEQKDIEIIEAEACPDHIHMLISFSPKYSISYVMGYLKGKSSLMIFDRHANLKYKYGNRHFWARGYFVDTVRFLYKGIIIKHNKTEPTYTKTSLFLCEKRRFFMARTEKGVVATI